ncbi:putative DD34D transposase [Trichonephila clavipes]|nr:putative DD34D transposase [Trichonephila clavipes]
MVTGDEKWVTYDNIVRKRSWSKRGEAAQTVAKPGLTARKILLCIWWDWKWPPSWIPFQRQQALGVMPRDIKLAPMILRRRGNELRKFIWGDEMTFLAKYSIKGVQPSINCSKGTIQRKPFEF